MELRSLLPEHDSELSLKRKIWCKTDGTSSNRYWFRSTADADMGALHCRNVNVYMLCGALEKFLT